MLKSILRSIKLFLGINCPKHIKKRQETATNQLSMAYLINKYVG